MQPSDGRVQIAVFCQNSKLTRTHTHTQAVNEWATNTSAASELQVPPTSAPAACSPLSTPSTPRQRSIAALATTRRYKRRAQEAKLAPGGCKSRQRRYATMESYLHVVRKSKTGLVVPDAALQASTHHANVPSDTTTTRHGTESSSGKELPSTARHNRVATNLPIGFGCFVLGSGPNTGSFGVATPLPGRGAGGSVVADSRPFIDRCPARQPHAHDGSTVKADTHTQ